MSENCMVCQRIEKIKRGENPYFVKELETGYVGNPFIRAGVSKEIP